MSSLGYFSAPAGLVIDADGDLLVVGANSAGPDTPGQILRVDPVTGDQTRITLGDNLVNPYAIAPIPEPATLALLALGALALVRRRLK